MVFGFGGWECFLELRTFWGVPRENLYSKVKGYGQLAASSGTAIVFKGNFQVAGNASSKVQSVSKVSRRVSAQREAGTYVVRLLPAPKEEDTRSIIGEIGTDYGKQVSLTPGSRKPCFRARLLHGFCTARAIVAPLLRLHKFNKGRRAYGCSGSNQDSRARKNALYSEAACRFHGHEFGRESKSKAR